MKSPFLGLVLLVTLLSCLEAKDLSRQNPEENKIISDTLKKLFKKRAEPFSTTEEPWTGRWMPERIKPTAKPEITEESWTGRWMPDRKTGTNPTMRPVPPMPPFPRAQFSSNYHETDLSYLRRISMGSSNKACDDGKTNLTLDWDESPDAYTCNYPSFLFAPDHTGFWKPELKEDFIPPKYTPAHLCMNESIEYDDNIPTFGNHRPVWPHYGEYKYLPMQRWLHNVEHGAVVMLYHPCASKKEVDVVRKVVTGCIRKHIITPYNKLHHKHAIVLVSWGAKLSLPYADEHLIRQFIAKYALKGPEGANPNEGRFDHMLVTAAEIVPGSDIADSNLCPNQWL